MSCQESLLNIIFILQNDLGRFLSNMEVMFVFDKPIIPLDAELNDVDASIWYVYKRYVFVLSPSPMFKNFDDSFS